MNPLDTVERFAREERPEEIDGEMIADYGEDQLRAKPGRLRAVGPHEVLSKLELRKIIEAAAPGMERTMLMVAILCGLRHGEIAGVRWPMVDFKRRTLTVNRSLTQLSKKRGGPRLEMPKRKKSVREIELPAPLVAELRQWKLACPPNPTRSRVRELARQTDLPPRQTRQAQGGLQASRGQAGHHAQPEAQLRLPATLERNSTRWKSPGSWATQARCSHALDLRPLDQERKIPRPGEARHRHHGGDRRSFGRGPKPKTFNKRLI